MPCFPEPRKDTALPPCPSNLLSTRTKSPCVLCPSDVLITCRLRLAFRSTPPGDCRLSYHQFGPVVLATGLGHFWRRPLFNFGLGGGLNSALGQDGGGDVCQSVGCEYFISRWLSLKILRDGPSGHRCLDPATLFVSLVGRGLKDRLSADDLLPWVEDVADRALVLRDSYLREPYVDTVLARLLLRYGSHLSGILTPSSLQVSGFSKLLDRLCSCTYPVRQENETSLVLDFPEDYADLPDEFSYDDFLAIFGLYWELTARQKSLHSIRQGDLYAYAPLSKRFLAEAFKVPCVRPFSISGTELSYPDFVWLIVSAEGKGIWPQSAEFLFRVLDLESDGVLTPDELHYFYMEHDNSVSRSFQDVMCELVDAVRPCDPSRFTLLDLRRSGVAHVFFSPFVDAPEYQRRWSNNRRRSSHATWYSTDPSPFLGCWEYFVQERLEHMRYADQLQFEPNSETSRKKHKKRHSKSRYNTSSV